MVAAFLIAAAMQAASQAPAVERVCSLVTPGGHSIEFLLMPWDDSGDLAGIVAGRGTVWPSRTLVGYRMGAQRSASGRQQFEFGEDDGLVVEVGQGDADSNRQSITLLRRSGARQNIPLAIGFCVPSPPSGARIFPAFDPRHPSDDVGQQITAFDPSQWPEDRCGMILSDGRRIPLRFELTGRDQVAMISSVLWDRQPVTAGIRSGARFSGRNGLSGTRELVVLEDGAMAAALIRFRNLGDPSAAGLTGYAICGYSHVVRRPVRS